MFTTVDIRRVPLNDEGHGVIPCGHCQSSQPIALAPHRPQALGQELVPITCPQCAHRFYVRCERRIYPRMPVDLPGTLLAPQTATVVGEVKVISLSMGGVGFLLAQDRPLPLGEVFALQFVLNDAEHSPMCEAITIRRTQGAFVGAEFAHQDRYRYALDFYLRDHDEACA